MARRPREPGQAEQAKFRHRGAPLETFHTFPAGSRMGVVPFSGFVTLEASPNPVCQPLGQHAPGHGWGCSESQAPRIDGICGEHHQGVGTGLQGEGILELRSPGDKMRSWKGYGLTDPVIHSFSRHS